MLTMRFGKEEKLIVLLSLLIFIGMVSVAGAFQVDESTPIGMKWVKLGGAAVVGNPISNVLQISGGAGQYQKFEKGVIFFSQGWGAVIVTNPIYEKWFSLRGQVNPSGQDLLKYMGVPIQDYTTIPDIEGGVIGEYAPFLNGAIVVRRAGNFYTTYVIYGQMYLRFWDVMSVTGWPTSDESAVAGVAGGRFQTFDTAEMYYDSTSSDGASEVHGPILQRWLALGGPGGSMGFPLSDVQPVIKDSATIGQRSQFQNGVIYYSDGTGAWEVTGNIRGTYENTYGGPAGWLGLPISGQGNTPTSGGVFNDFQNGVLVHHDSGPYAGCHAFDKLQFYVQRMGGYGCDLSGCVGGPMDLYAYFKVTTPAGLVVDERIPSSGDCDDCGEMDINRLWDLAQPVNSGLTVDVWIKVMDADPGEDDQLGIISQSYSIDNLWGTLDNTEHSGSTADRSCKVWFSMRNPQPDFKITDFPAQAYWSFYNFDTPSLTYDQYAQTFTDVSPDEIPLLHPWNWFYYGVAYQGIANGGNCFGMSLESINAQKDKSMYAEPIFLYPSNDGLVNEINVKHGYQLGADEIKWFLSEFLGGMTHNPKEVFKESKAAFERGDDPTISIFSDYNWADGHNVRPYKWDDHDSDHWVISIADSNNPAGTSNYKKSYLVINTQTNCYSYPDNIEDINYAGCGWQGGRMLYFPYHIMDKTPRTPFWDLFGLLGDIIVAVGSTGQTNQITDGAGHTFYEQGLTGPPERWDQEVQDDASRIPNLARIGLTDGGERGPEIYAGNGDGFTYHYDVLPRAGVADNTPYEWLFNSGTLSAHLVIPGTSGVPDTITIGQSGTPDQAVSLAIPAAGKAKEVEWTMSGGVKSRWAKLTHLKMVPSQSIEMRVKNGGYKLEFQNSGPATTAELEVLADPDLNPVTVGSLSIPNGASEFNFDAPVTTLTYSGGQVGNNGWLLSPVTVTLQAVEYSGTGIDFIEYSLDGTTWTTYTAPFLYAEEGQTTLYYRAMDKARDQEPAKSQVFKIDTRQPVVTVPIDKPSYTRVEPFIVHFVAIDPVPGSGLKSLSATLDGDPVADGQIVNIFWKALGTHTLTATASDIAGWTTTKSASFEIAVTLDSLKGTIAELRRSSEIDNDGIEQSLLAKVDAATASETRGQKQAALNQLQALLNEIRAQAGKHITQRAADLLTADVNYIIAHIS